VGSALTVKIGQNNNQTDYDEHESYDQSKCGVDDVHSSPALKLGKGDMDHAAIDCFAIDHRCEGL
jgi:hypothetical protein